MFEGIPEAGNPTLLNQIYTEIYITEGLERSMMNMRSDRLKQHPGKQAEQKHPSDKKTSLNSHLEEMNQSEQ